MTKQLEDMSLSLNPRKNRLGETLIAQGAISHDQLDIALKEQEKINKPLGKALISLGFLSEAVLRDALSEVQGRESIDLKQLVPDAQAIHMLPKHLAMRFCIAPIMFDVNKKTLSIAMSDIYDLRALDHIRASIKNNFEIIPVLAAENEIRDAIDRFYGYNLSVDGILHEIETGEMDLLSLNKQNNEYSHPLVRLVDSILADAVKRRASDIHFEPEASFLRLRYRIDGVLRQIRSLHRDYWSGVVVRLKVLAKMNIAETRAPQDGRISLKIHGNNIDFRVSVQPVLHGENIVIRVLDRTKGVALLDDLNLRKDALNSIKTMMARPEGIILVTGPTGSGKTTTLYSMLNYINSDQVNIMTLEDPVEYPMDRLRQTSINEVARMNFANGIRSLMRQDPDIILVGEVRDKDTAKMAFRAAMTGHQVYTSLHTNSAIGSLSRLQDIGINNELMSGNIIGIIGQRLVRKLCMHCKKPTLSSARESKLLASQKRVSLYSAKGCHHCDNSGYKGRLAVIEVLKLNTELDEMIAEKQAISKIKKYIKQQGFTTLADDACRLVKEGLTSLDEIARVIDLTERI